MDWTKPALPPSDAPDVVARWLRDRECVKQLMQRYSYGVDTRDFAVVRSVFHPDCRVEGTLEDGALEPYLEGIEEGIQQWAATFHFVGNQYVELDGERGHMESWCLGYHMEAEDSPIDDVAFRSMGCTPSATAVFRTRPSIGAGKGLV